MKIWENQWFGPVAAVRPYLFHKCFMLLVALDTLVLMAERGGRYGLDRMEFNVAHFVWLDAVQRIVLPGGVPVADYYTCLLVLTSFFAFTLALTGQHWLRTAMVTLLYTYCWSMSRLDSYLHHYMISLILGCCLFFPRIEASQLRDWMLNGTTPEKGGERKPRKTLEQLAWKYTWLLAGLALLYRLTLSQAVNLAIPQRWVSMFICAGVLALLVWRWQRQLQAGAGPLTTAWSFRLLATTVGVIYVFTATAKMDAEWCGGHTLKQVGATATVLQPIEQLAAWVGVSPDLFWSGLATFVIPLELTLAICYFLASRQDEYPWLQRCCFLGWLLALGLHLNNEMMNLIIQWFGYYMLFLATLILLPARLLLALSTVFVWPELWIREEYQRWLDARSVGQRAAVLAIVTLLALALLALAGFYLGVLGALFAVIIIAVGMVALLVVGLVMSRDWKLLSISCVTGVAALLMMLAVAQCTMRFDYYELRGRTLQQQGLHQPAIEELTIARGFPTSPRGRADLHTNLAISHSALGDDSTAAKHHRQAIRLDPASFLSHYSLANLFVRLNQHDQAIEHYRSAILIKPDFSDAYVNLGNVFEFQGHFPEALRNYRMAAEIEPQARDIRGLIDQATAKLSAQQSAGP